EQEGEPPAPGGQGLGRQRRGEEGGDGGAREEASPDAHLLPAPREPTPTGRRVLDEEGRHARPLAACREALGEAEPEQRERREDADAAVGREDSDDEGRGPHQDDGGGERIAAAARVAVVTKEEATQRAHEETDTEDAETQEQRAVRDVRGKEQRADGRGKVGVDREVV